MQQENFSCFFLVNFDQNAGIYVSSKDEVLIFCSGTNTLFLPRGTSYFVPPNSPILMSLIS